MSQLDMFDGATFEPEHDGERLSRQMSAVKRVMADGRWHTLKELAKESGGSEAGVSARLRDLRKSRFGAHAIERRRDARSKGLHWYRLREERMS